MTENCGAGAGVHLQQHSHSSKEADSVCLVLYLQALGLKQSDRGHTVYILPEASFLPESAV